MGMPVSQMVKEIEKKKAADRNFEAEQKKKEERQKRNMGLGSAVSSGDSSLG